MGSEEQTPCCTHSFPPPTGGLGPSVPTLLRVSSGGMALSAAPSLHAHPRDRLHPESEEEPAAARFISLGASPAEMYRLCLSRRPCRLNHRPACRLDGARNPPRLATRRGRAAGPVHLGLGGPGASQLPFLSPVRTPRPEMGRHIRSSHQGKCTRREF